GPAAAEPLAEGLELLAGPARRSAPAGRRGRWGVYLYPRALDAAACAGTGAGKGDRRVPGPHWCAHAGPGACAGGARGAPAAAARPVGRVGEGDDIAKQILTFMTLGFATGSVVYIDGGALVV